ncbi:hypothetical protein [Niabella beijingensis]|uniref:hypothetical protein n=1 Tax=Niabella beijingensis TaxID=2872700 RepID=UPI001CBF8FA0|nr:hypothetical protein [Niabella beijingensis]MBZ4188102.1 hypothetical protein [Niabella beijingensis]
MTTIAQWQANDLQSILYRLLVKGTAPQEPVTDHSEGKGLFETAVIVDPFGSVFRMMTGKDGIEIIEKNKTR